MEAKKKICTKCKKLSIIWKTCTVGGEKLSLCQQYNSKIEIDPFTPRVFIYYPKHILIYD